MAMVFLKPPHQGTEIEKKHIPHFRRGFGFGKPLYFFPDRRGLGETPCFFSSVVEKRPGACFGLFFFFNQRKRKGSG
jgi:hypothetical protein